MVNLMKLVGSRAGLSSFHTSQPDPPGVRSRQEENVDTPRPRSRDIFCFSDFIFFC